MAWDLGTSQGLKQLNTYLSTRSFMSGYTATAADVDVFNTLAGKPGREYPHVLRFYSTLASYSRKEIQAASSIQSEEGTPSVTCSGGGAKTANSSSGSTADPYSNRTFVSTILGQDGGVSFVGQKIVVGGWVKSGRDQKQFAFIALNDGSTPKNIQIVVLPEIGVSFSQLIPTGTSLLIEGTVKPTPSDVKNAKQLVELHASKIMYVGPCDSSNPIAKTKLGLEFLRSVSHLRPRTNTISAVARIRNTLAFATHQFFQSSGFKYVHTPLLTASDCEGAGEMFQVTTLLTAQEKRAKLAKVDDSEFGEAEKKVSDLAAEVAQLKESKAKAKVVKQTASKLTSAKKTLEELAFRRSLIAGIPYGADGSVDYSKDFFSKPSFLTVSGQLEAEVFACAMSSVYTFGPTFRAEDSHTTRHLAEFWMIEPEISFCDIQGNMQCAEDYVKFCCQAVLDTCLDDLEFMNLRIDKTCLERVKHVANSSFGRITYTEAVELLLDHIAKKKVKFENEVFWGVDLSSEHERYICEKVYQSPVIVYNYPKEIKAFYMRLNDDDKTVGAMDVLVPGVGELIGGSQREERLDVLEKRIVEAGLELEPYSWYLDLRKFGTVPHSGFGLGFERLVLFVTGMDNIRDVIPFPRWPGHCDL